MTHPEQPFDDDFIDQTGLRDIDRSTEEIDIDTGPHDYGNHQTAAGNRNPAPKRLAKAAAIGAGLGVVVGVVTAELPDLISISETDQMRTCANALGNDALQATQILKECDTDTFKDNYRPSITDISVSGSRTISYKLPTRVAYLNKAIPEARADDARTGRNIDIFGVIMGSLVAIGSSIVLNNDFKRRGRNRR